MLKVRSRLDVGFGLVWLSFRLRLGCRCRFVWLGLGVVPQSVSQDVLGAPEKRRCAVRSAEPQGVSKGKSLGVSPTKLLATSQVAKQMPRWPLGFTFSMTVASWTHVWGPSNFIRGQFQTIAIVIQPSQIELRLSHVKPHKKAWKVYWNHWIRRQN